jgi:hypothetical protein
VFYLKSDRESNTNKVEDFISFPTVIYLPSSDERFRWYDYLPDDMVAENYNSRQIAASREK